MHCDLWGPYREPSTNGSRYFLTIVDDFSRAVWMILLLEKSEAPNALKTFCAFVTRQFQKHIKTIRSDNGPEFLCLRKFFADEGIVHQTSCVETPQQNGRVERKHRHILNVARAFLFQGNLPKKYWGESVMTATYLINRTPTAVLKNKTPYELLYGSPLSYENLRVFGTLYYARCISRNKDKFDPRSSRCVFLGYPMGKKGWVVCDLESDKLFVSRDVVFHENIFPYRDISPTDKSSDATVPNHMIPQIVDMEDPGELEVSVDTVVPSGNEQGGDITETGGVSSSPVEVTDQESSSATTTVQNNTTTETDGHLGRGRREKKQSVLLSPYVLYSAQHNDKPPSSPASTPCPSKSGTSLYPLTKYMSCHRLSPAMQSFSATITEHFEPKSYREAVKHKIWRGSMKHEIVALEDRDTWEVTILPPNKQVIGCQWIYKNKYNADGTLERPKSRLVACGNNQEEGIDYTETFAPVVKSDYYENCTWSCSI